MFGRGRKFVSGCLAHYLADGFLIRWVFLFIHPKDGIALEPVCPDRMQRRRRPPRAGGSVGRQSPSGVTFRNVG